MGLRFFKRIKLASGLTLNLSKSGPSFSFGPRGLKYTVGPRGTRQTFGLPGTGLYYTTTSWRGRKNASSSSSSVAAGAPPSLDLGFFRSVFTPAEDRDLVAGLKQYLSGMTEDAYSTFRANTALVDSVFMFGFLALGKDSFMEAEAAFLKCRGSIGELGKAIHKYIQGFRLSLQVTEYIDAPVDVEQRGLSLALAEAYQRQGKFTEAMREVTGLWNRDPSDLVVCLSLCDLVAANPSVTRTDLEEIVQITSQVKNDEPIHTNILYLRGATMYRMQILDGAVQQLSVLLRKKADRPDALLHQIRYLRGRLYEQQNQKARAKRDYELIYAENPGYKDVLARLRQFGP